MTRALRFIAEFAVFAAGVALVLVTAGVFGG